MTDTHYFVKVCRNCARLTLLHRAMDLAASFIGESIIFTAAMAAVIFETVRKRVDDGQKVEAVEQKFRNLQNELDELKKTVGAILPEKKP